MQAAPIELLQIGLDPANFKRAATDEFHGPCPRCGGNDRFVVHTGNNFPKWYMWCRDGIGHCGWKGWADQLNPAIKEPISEADKQRWVEQQRQKEQSRSAELANILRRYTQAEVWHAYHSYMAEAQRQWWREQGIPDSWQDYLELGYTEHYPASDFQTDAYTIPFFHNTGEGKSFKTMQYRLCKPPQVNDRYRFAYGLPSAYYNADPYEPIGDKVIICEGAKKAIVTGTLLHVTHSVLAYPSLSTMSAVTEAVKDCGYIRIIPDPDGYDKAVAFARKYLPQAKVVKLFVKVDDAINQYGMKVIDLLAAMRQAV
jgi:hypothetical protein